VEQKDPGHGSQSTSHAHSTCTSRPAFATSKSSTLRDAACAASHVREMDLDVITTQYSTSISQPSSRSSYAPHMASAGLPHSGSNERSYTPYVTGTVSDGYRYVVNSAHHRRVGCFLQQSLQPAAGTAQQRTFKVSSHQLFFFISYLVQGFYEPWTR
jgi:hypothetical protein